MEPTTQATIPMEASSPSFDAGTSILAGVTAIDEGGMNRLATVRPIR
ncbi:MAG TPA: hypothetical protein QF572_00195 [Vicinamibacterales bacterium]|jgi:hypothetical protein|nr:hypothetical protein [Vicinamibacterales bacterium]|tara:strand:- start:1432 stop:1572 length:141 start_codon:yes stop_codon:yes gene_type:complete